MMIDGFHSSHNVSDGVIDTYVLSVRDFSAASVHKAAMDFIDATLDRNHGFRPTAPEFAARARVHHQAEQFVKGRSEPKLVRFPLGKLPDNVIPLGPTRVDFGQGSINMEGMSCAEKEAILANKGRLPDKAKPRLQKME